MPSLSSSAVTIICAISVTFFAFTLQRCSDCASADLSLRSNKNHLEISQYEYTGKPHQSSWNSWYHPQRIEHNERLSASQALRAGVAKGDWNILYHLGGNGPWVEKVVDTVEGGITVPEGCTVEQVHMMARHAERYPTKRVAKSGFQLMEHNI